MWLQFYIYKGYSQDQPPEETQDRVWEGLGQFLRPFPLESGYFFLPHIRAFANQEAPLNSGILGSNYRGTIDWIIGHVIELNPQSMNPIQRLGWLKAPTLYTQGCCFW